MKMRYVVDDILPANQIHLFAGASGAGKTTLALQYMRHLLDGVPWFNHPVHPPKSFAYVACDRQGAEYEDKFEKLRIKPFPIHSLVEDPKFDPLQLSSPKGRMDAFPAVWEACGRPHFFVLDPISPFLPSDLKDYHAVASALLWFTRFCIKNDVTIWAHHHAGKLRMDGQFARAQDRINGSGALLGYSGTQVFITDAAEVQDAPGYYILTINPHNAPPETHKLIRTEGTGAFDHWTEADVVARDYRVLALVPEEPASIPYAELTGTAANMLDVCPKTIQRTLENLLTSGKVVREKGRYSKPRVN